LAGINHSKDVLAYQASLAPIVKNPVSIQHAIRTVYVHVAIELHNPLVYAMPTGVALHVNSPFHPVSLLAPTIVYVPTAVLVLSSHDA
jgi:hypothetical protein